MMTDFLNGVFEALGGSMIALNCLRLYRDKQLHGINPMATVFFNSWGLWNCVFYPANGLWWSFWGGLCIVSANTVWLGQMLYYTRVYPWLQLMEISDGRWTGTDGGQELRDERGVFQEGRPDSDDGVRQDPRRRPF